MVSRKPWVGGNWKCNGSKGLIKDLAEAFNGTKFEPSAIDVAIFPTAVHIPYTRELLESKFIVGSQNISRTGSGAYTGEHSVDILKDMNVEWTLIGHSERRTLYGESDAVVAEKVEAAQKGGMHAGLCIGETLEEREANKTKEVCERQIDAAVPKITDWSKIVIAYEPVWAIGTGKVATKEQAQEAHDDIRKHLACKVSKEVADSVRIVYGGSVNEKNCDELAKMPDIDGFLVGGASLKPAFSTVISTLAENRS
eukprot:Gregarina_sp_Poly_1__10612@NODE_793_length_6259_cov_699_484819_g455_i1_p2_GENE_NODE_793_length_6259_cov_699_484819_g455_i1NODE_793_length_6259_cov_699_484819_g455_i1_p2_ORF_typecomplete_len254_score48_69TIM/PF00121_18/2_2e92CutC/PF03932_14/0_0016_NODE_793_length_6259_cov_699_484819_g455_i154546215